GEGLAYTLNDAGPERKNRPSRTRPDARHWQRVAGSSPRAAWRSRIKAEPEKATASEGQKNRALRPVG
ncbi:hypothetical protein ACH6XI_29495, partial [Klebsiella pneumoniae]|nr:hypothetical protein [Klebsiella pneumoniae]